VTTPAAPAPAVQTPNENVAGAVHTVHRSAKPTAAGVAPAAHVSGTLPFTGAQLATFVVMGLLLIGGGFVLRLSGRTRTDA
jgi:hypothetical protein